MKKNPDLYLGKAYEPVSDVFHAAVEDTLSKIGKEQQMKVRHIPKIWAIAAAFILVVGTAFAAGSSLGLMDFLLNDESGVLPLENAQFAIQSKLVTHEDDQVRWKVEQAVYDGECVRALVKAAPVNPETHALFFPFIDDLPMTIANRNVQDEMASKTPVNVGFPELMPAGDGQMVDIDRTIIQGVYLSETGEYSMYVFCPVALRGIDSAPEELVLWLYDSGDDRKKAGFTLNKCENQKAVYLNNDTSFSDTTVRSVVLTQTPFASYLEIDYAYARTGPGMTLSNETTYYATEFGRFLHTDPACSGIENAMTLTYEEAISLDKDYLCPVCAGGSLEAIRDTTTGGQIDFSITSLNTLHFFSGYDTETENGFKKTYIFSAEAEFPEEITLHLLKKGEYTGEKLTLDRIR